MMKLYNTLTRQIEDILPLQPPAIGVYTCGPTVYDYAHIGHWFNYIRMDLLIRALIVAGYTPNWIMNITDVGHLVSDADEGEDKLEKGARREGKTAWEVAEFYTQDFLQAMALLNITQVQHLTKATDHIPEQIALIQTLVDKGYTYTIRDGVYFDTTKFARYGDFAQLDLDEQKAGARVTVNTEKRNPADFALWKFSAETSGGVARDMEWDNPFGNGRKGFPGWHIECSAMSMKYLGQTLDMHTGGIDHIPVHHTNEIAQSEAATSKPFAKYWMHSNHVMVNGEKISKSLGNGIRLQELMEKGISPEAVRLHVLESHYRSQSQFSLESLQAAANRLQNWYAYAALRWQAAPLGGSTKAQPWAQYISHDIYEPLMNDLNTPQVLARVDQRFTTSLAQTLSETDRVDFETYLTALDDALGTKLMQQPDITDTQKQLIAEREAARAGKHWAQSDSLRNQLHEEGIELRDTSAGANWLRR